MLPCHHVPSVLLGDRGELESHKADNLVTMLGIRVENAPPYRGDLKPIIESHFKTINTQVKPFVPGAVQPDDRQRGGKDYRLDAKLDIVQFTRIIINCVIYYNTRHYLAGFEKSGQMLKTGVEAIPSKLWYWGIRNYSGVLRTFPQETVRLALMPRDNGSVTEKGIYFRKLYYSCPEAREGQWFENARKNGRYKVQVSYDPRDMSSSYVWEKNSDGGHKCSLLDWEVRFSGKSLDEVVFEQEKQELQKKGNERAEMEAAINLNRAIDAIVADAEKMAPAAAAKTKAERLADIRENRKKEKEALREEEAFTAENGTEPCVLPEERKDASGDEVILTPEDWEEMTPIQRMLWKDLLERGDGDGSSEEKS
ncbi:MAG: Mu transposase C-terminal domain-containing protein [Lachnospiraceae bacterium]|nr:Mu transposase C-terminal domain-containing protein [Lachnospiraceae bacterium]